jgi:hypothetical protein
VAQLLVDSNLSHAVIPHLAKEFVSHESIVDP